MKVVSMCEDQRQSEGPEEEISVVMHATRWESRPGMMMHFQQFPWHDTTATQVWNYVTVKGIPGMK
jgi:hypothetical protein